MPNSINLNWIEQAAELQGKNCSEVMLKSAYQQAQDVLLDRNFFGLNADQYH